MKTLFSRQRMITIVIAFILAVMIGMVCSLMIHRLGTILGAAKELLGNDAETIGLIFSQLKEAEVEVPSVLLLFLCLLETTGVLRFVRGRKGLVSSKKKLLGRIIGIAIPALMGVVLIFGITLWFTDVNEIRFGTVLKFLYDALQHGVF